MRHEAWSDGSFFPAINRSAAAQLEAGATLVWTIEAASWHDAMTLYHEWKGWRPYLPMDDDSVVYTPEQEFEAAGALESPHPTNQVETDGDR